MTKLRIIHDNIADSTTSIAASTTAGALAAAYMQTDIKGQAHRSTGTSVSYTLTWSAAQTVGGVALPAINLTSAATIRARLYSDTACTALVSDSGTLTACPGLDIRVWGFSTLDVNAFSYGGAAKTALWFPTQPATIKGCIIDIVDTGNPAGYIDCARLVIGPYFEPTYNAEYGAQVGPRDMTTNTRSDAGDLVPDSSPQHEVMSLQLSNMSEADRIRLRAILFNVGTRRSFYLSVFSAPVPSALERDHSIYGKRENSLMSLDYFAHYGNQLSIESW
jgi:hypothetical protein